MGGDRRSERFILGIESHTYPDVPIPSDTHRASLSHSGARFGSVSGIAGTCQQYNRDGQGEFHRRIR